MDEILAKLINNELVRHLSTETKTGDVDIEETIGVTDEKDNIKLSK